MFSVTFNYFKCPEDNCHVCFTVVLQNILGYLHENFWGFFDFVTCCESLDLKHICSDAPCTTVKG